MVWLSDPILTYWLKTRGEDGPLGYPVGAQKVNDKEDHTGAFIFEHGIVSTSGEILQFERLDTSAATSI
jgi:uncharacterized protein with LGFP repeats